MRECSIYIEIQMEFYKNWKTTKNFKRFVIGVIEVIK